MRDRLIELINFGHNGIGLPRNKYKSVAEITADYLLEHGVIVPPCKVGDMIHVEYYGEIVNAHVTEFEINSKGIVIKVYIDPDTYMEYGAEDVFTSREEAEQALKGGDE